VAASRLRGPGWRILAGIAVATILWFGGPAALQRLDFFRIRRIEFSGVRYLSAKSLTSALRLGTKSSVFDDLSRMERRLRGVPGVRAVSVGRRLPGTLTVSVTEVEPVALTPRNSGLAPIDLRGRVLPYDPAQAAPDLPIATTADSIVAQVLAVVREADPALFARLITAARVKDDVMLEADGHRLWFTGNTTAEDIRAVMAVAQDLSRQNREYRELDGRFAGQVIVRWAGA
jgi:cell division septal protein FtsQ